MIQDAEKVSFFIFLKKKGKRPSLEYSRVNDAIFELICMSVKLDISRTKLDFEKQTTPCQLISR